MRAARSIMRVSLRSSAKPLAASALLLGVVAAPAVGSTAGADTRLSNDAASTGGYVSNYNLNHPGRPVAKDSVLAECSRARGRQFVP